MDTPEGVHAPAPIPIPVQHEEQAGVFTDTETLAFNHDTRLFVDDRQKILGELKMKLLAQVQDECNLVTDGEKWTSLHVIRGRLNGIYIEYVPDMSPPTLLKPPIDPEKGFDYKPTPSMWIAKYLDVAGRPQTLDLFPEAEDACMHASADASADASMHASAGASVDPSQVFAQARYTSDDRDPMEFVDRVFSEMKQKQLEKEAKVREELHMAMQPALRHLHQSMATLEKIKYIDGILHYYARVYKGGAEEGYIAARDVKGCKISHLFEPSH